jgi:hypothetical protein
VATERVLQDLRAASAPLVGQGISEVRLEMGDFANKASTTIIGWLTMAVLCVADRAFVYSLFSGQGAQ